MRYFILTSVCALALAGCDTTGFFAQSSRADAPEISCLTRPQGGCTFNLSPLRVLNEPVAIPKRPYKFFPTAEPLRFVDARGVAWDAPARTLTDGASIPEIFVSIVGDPASPEFINAAAVHDAYCGIGNEQGPNYQRARWQDVHVMFYDGLIVGGTPEIRAKIMFAAVWLGGPRWADPPGAVVSTQGQAEARGVAYVNRLEHVPTWRLQQAMRRAKSYIEATRPPLPRLIRFLEAEERRMLEEIFGLFDEDAYGEFSYEPPHSGYVGETPVDPGGSYGGGSVPGIAL